MNHTLNYTSGVVGRVSRSHPPCSCKRTPKVKYPKFLSNDALSLLKGLLARDPLKRLGSGTEGSEEVRKHAFFKSINWAKLERREVSFPTDLG